MVSKKLTLLLSQIDRYSSLGRSLFPLKPKSKIPLEMGWQTRDYSIPLLHRYVQRGHNLGWRLGPLDVVIDVDPRHEGATESTRKLTTDWIDPVRYPLVRSGGADKGQHYYAKLPHPVKIKKTIPELPGIDFLREGNYVLIPGCVHPETGRLYHHDPFSPDIAPRLPAALVTLLTPTRPPITDATELLTLAQIEAHLAAIPPEQYREYDAWLKIGMAVHAASGGDPDAEELWAAWSTRDPEYADAEDVARAKWASFADRTNGITAATLIRAAMDHGGSPVTISPVELFADEPEETETLEDKLQRFLAKLAVKEPPSITQAVRRALKFGLDNWDECRRQIKQYYNASFDTIDRARKEIERQIEQARKEKKRRAAKAAIDEDDAAIAAAVRLLNDRFEGGRLLVHATNQAFYHFRNTHWQPLAPNITKQLLLDAALDVKMDDANDLEFKASALFSSSEQVLVAKTAQMDDVFRFEGPLPSVVNTRTAEVWLTDAGSPKPQPHNPESYLLSCLDVDYNPDAECPRMDRALAQIFRDNKDPEQMTRHLWEVFGYTIQPQKDIPAWLMWWGRGSNGKSILSEILMGLMGAAVLPRPLEAFADSNRNNHATASLVGKLLVIDDDAETTTNIPESALKKLAEAKQIEANPKNRAAFSFIHCATPLILLNDWPRTKDLSYGLRRKCFIIPFMRRFEDHERDLTIKRKIINNEMSGVLNRALEGYRRLRKRGHFKEPAECIEAKNEWLKSANPLLEFITSHIKVTGNGSAVLLGELHSDYRAWCALAGGVRNPLPLHRFALALQQLDYNVDAKRVLGVERIEG